MTPKTTAAASEASDLAPSNTVPPTPEDLARADVYALLARLFYSGVDAELLHRIAAATAFTAAGEDHGFAVAWNVLRTVAASADPAAVATEFDAVFIGTGRAPVTPYASFYLLTIGREKVVVALRDELAALGLARSTSANEPEDHIAGLMDVMRHLVLAGSDAASLERQSDFFRRYLERSMPALCRAVDECAGADFYRAVAALARSFISIETQGLLMV